MKSSRRFAGAVCWHPRSEGIFAFFLSTPAPQGRRTGLAPKMTAGEVARGSASLQPGASINSRIRTNVWDWAGRSRNRSLTRTSRNQRGERGRCRMRRVEAANRSLTVAALSFDSRISATFGDFFGSPAGAFSGLSADKTGRGSRPRGWLNRGLSDRSGPSFTRAPISRWPAPSSRCCR